MRKKIFFSFPIIAVLLILAVQFNLYSLQPPGIGRLSPASLDLDTCGCPSWFDQPVCEEWTNWTIEKTTASGPFTDPENEPFSFTVTVTEGATEQILTGMGQIILTNSGEQTTYLSSIVVNLEKVRLAHGPGGAPGPSGKNWEVLATAIQNESDLCDGLAVTCYGDLSETDGSYLVLYDPDSNDTIALTADLEIPATLDNDGDGLRDEDPVYTGLNDTANSCDIIDNDGDGLYDEDPIDGIDNDADGAIDEDDPDDDGDGLVDEDGACEDAVTINFTYEFDIAGMGIEGPGDGIVPSMDDLRINLMATFKAGGKRGGTCKNVDVNCNDEIDDDEDYVRTIQQRLRFDPVACSPVCDCVDLVDLGAYALDPACAIVTTNALYESICATGVEGTISSYDITGTVTCDCINMDVQGALDDAASLFSPIGNVTISVSYPYNGGPAYFPHTYINNAGDLDGDYLGWCVDTAHTIGNGTVYNAQVISSYPEANVPPGYVDYPENLDLVNWILNQGYVGTLSGCSDTYYTYGDVQRSIWALVENTQSTSGLGSWSQCRVDEILAAAYASGEGFVPGCDEYVGVILAPVNNAQVIIAQVIMAEIPLVCDCVPCSTTVTNIATLTCEDPDLITGSPASASFDVVCTGAGVGIEVGDFCTQTQGGWGNTPQGQNPGQILHDNFDTLYYPGGLIVGDPDGPDSDNCFAIWLTSAQAVTDYLPAGGPPAALHCTEPAPGPCSADQTNPDMTSSGVFGGQLVAATINVAMDDAGIRTDAYPPGTLGQLIYVDGCVNVNLVGLSVNEVIAMANDAIQGCNDDLLPAGVTVSNLSDALAVLNENFVDCDTNLGCLALPLPE